MVRTQVRRPLQRADQRLQVPRQSRALTAVRLGTRVSDEGYSRGAYGPA
jgi:hypothetical protein